MSTVTQVTTHTAKAGAGKSKTYDYADAIVRGSTTDLQRLAEAITNLKKKVPGKAGDPSATYTPMAYVAAANRGGIEGLPQNRFSRDEKGWVTLCPFLCKGADGKFGAQHPKWREHSWVASLMSELQEHCEAFDIDYRKPRIKLRVKPKSDRTQAVVDYARATGLTCEAEASGAAVQVCTMLVVKGKDVPLPLAHSLATDDLGVGQGAKMTKDSSITEVFRVDTQPTIREFQINTVSTEEDGKSTQAISLRGSPTTDTYHNHRAEVDAILETYELAGPKLNLAKGAFEIFLRLGLGVTRAHTLFDIIDKFDIAIGSPANVIAAATARLEGSQPVAGKAEEMQIYSLLRDKIHNATEMLDVKVASSGRPIVTYPAPYTAPVVSEVSPVQ